MKIEVVVFDMDGVFLVWLWMFNLGLYDVVVYVVCDLVVCIESEIGVFGIVGVGMLGLVDLCDGMMCNVNVIFFNGYCFCDDLLVVFGCDVRLVNDVNCLVLFEVVDGVVMGVCMVFVVIIGIGVGGGLVVDGNIVEGVNGMGGEWGYVLLFWMIVEEFLGLFCWCGCYGCFDILVLGIGL